MITPEYLRQMASYNRWQNERLYALCADLSDEERKRDRGMFFRSIHATLEHILYIDRVILKMVRTGQPTELAFGRPLLADFVVPRREREQLDAEFARFASEHPAAWLGEKANPDFRFSRGFQLTQMFNHQTHHRGQVTSELHKLGVDYGRTDLPYNPYLQL
ncbi:MAG: damage-inducible protein DinB [Myxococcales bacterium]|nr:damage-inducible protein DinB [Myxococcales bacterium]